MLIALPLICLIGGWWAATEFEDISGTIAIEMGEMRYIEALDNGLFKIGDSHEAGMSLSP